MNINTITVKTYNAPDPWPRYAYRVECRDCGAVVGQSTTSMGRAIDQADGHQCKTGGEA